MLTGTAGFGFSSTLIAVEPASPDTVLYTERMTSGRLSVVTGLFDTKEATMSLKTEPCRSMDDKGQWKDDPLHLKQVLTFVGDDGPVQLFGTVAESEAVELKAAWKVVVLANLSTKSLPAFDKGRVSKTLVALGIVKVVEVWESASKCLWRAKDEAAKGTGATVDMATGKVARA